MEWQEEYQLIKKRCKEFIEELKTDILKDIIQEDWQFEATSFHKYCGEIAIRITRPGHHPFIVHRVDGVVTRITVDLGSDGWERAKKIGEQTEAAWWGESSYPPSMREYCGGFDIYIGNRHSEKTQPTLLAAIIRADEILKEN